MSATHLLSTSDWNTVVMECQIIEYEWKKLGTYLHVSSPTIMSISTSHQSNFDKLSAVISSWLRKDLEKTATQHPSWRVLCDALKMIGHRELAEKIALKYRCTASTKSTINSLQQPAVMVPAVKSIDFSKVIASPSESPKEIFREYSAKITGLISANPIKVGNDLVSVRLVSQTSVDELSTQLALSDYHKATQLMNTLARSFRVKDDPQILLSICSIFMQQDDPLLDEMVCEMVLKLAGGITENAGMRVQSSSVTDEQDRNSASVDSQPSEDQQDTNTNTSPQEDCKLVYKRIKDFFSTTNKEKLKRAFDRNLKQIAEELFKAEVISKGVKENPSYDGIIEEFLDTLEFIDNTEQLKEDCSKFLKVLHSIGGPTKRCSEWISREINCKID